MSERVWIAPGRSEDRAATSYDRALAIARAEAQAGHAFLKTRTTRWRAWQNGLPLHRKRWSLCEARALQALRAAGVPAVEPLLAGARSSSRSGEAFLSTRRHDGSDLESKLVLRTAPAKWSAELGELVAVLHGASFVHRDLFLRNVLRTGGGLVLLDAHRSRKVRMLAWVVPRGVLYDLACLDLDLAALASTEERKVFWASYLARRPEAPRAARVREAVRRRQRGLVVRFLAKRPAARAARLARMKLELPELLERWVRR